MAKALSKKVVAIVDRLRREGQSSGDADRSTENLIVIGTSAGGHQALRHVVKGLSDDIPAAIVVLLHRLPSTSGRGGFQLEEWLQLSTKIPIIRVQHGARLKSGVISIVPPGTAVSLKGSTMQVTEYKRGPGPASTINTLFASAAREFDHRVIAVVLTGLLRDGTEGLKAVHEAGGITIVQDPAGAEYPDMPASAMRDLPVTFCLELGDIGAALDLLARRKVGLETGLTVSVRAMKGRVALLARLMAQSKRNPVTFQFLCVEMAALQRELSMLEALVAKALAEDAVYQASSKGDGV